MQKINDNLQKNTFKFVYEKSKTELKTKIGEKGITLIALIITIIMMLILAGVTISAISGNDGILSKSKKAVSDYSKAAAEEEMKLYLTSLEMEKNASGDRLADYLKSHIGEDGLEDYQNNGDGTAQVVLNGKRYKVNLSDGTYTYVGEGTGAVRNIKQVLNSNNQDVPGVAMVGAGDIETEDLGWEVLKNNGDTVDLIAINNTSFEVNISGINGYTNGVKALNDICSKLYGNLEINGTKVTSARNVNADDFYDITYSTTKTYSSASKVQPMIAKLDTENNGFSTDQITDYVDPTNTSGSQSSNSNMLNAAATGVKIVRPTTRTAKSTSSFMNTGNQYWIATREMETGYDSSYGSSHGGDIDANRYEAYRLEYARTDGALTAIDLFTIYYTNTSGNNVGTTAALRPVITVPASLISDKTVGAKVTTDPFYKGKTGTEAHGYTSADSLTDLIGTDIKSLTKIDAGLPTAEADMTWTKLTDGGYDTSSGSFDTSKYDYYVAARTTKLQVRLTGAQGYNNGVLALDTVCNNIYGGETSIKLSNGKTKKVKIKQARNAKFEDFWDESSISKNTTNGYGSTWSTDSGKASSTSAVITASGNRWTPTIYSKENLDSSNLSKGYSDSKITTYNMSKNTAYYNNSTSLTDDNRNSYSAEYKNPRMTVMYNALWGTAANRNTAISLTTSNSSGYWLSSRCVSAGWSNAYFYLRCVSDSGSLYTNGVFHSSAYVYSPCFGLRPVLVVEK